MQSKSMNWFLYQGTGFYIKMEKLREIFFDCLIVSLNIFEKFWFEISSSFY